MASRENSFKWLAGPSSVILWVLSCAPLAAQNTERLEAKVASAMQAPVNLSLTSSGIPATADAVIEDMARAAGVIFAGQVIAIRRPVGFTNSGQDAARGIVEVDFRVDQAVRGPASGAVFTLREWSGLWNGNGGNERYRIGQRLLVFLYEPDISGLSSPVHGRDGAVPLRGGGIAPGPDDATSFATEWLVDLRWVQARALKGEAVVLPPVPRPIYPRPVHGIEPETYSERPGFDFDQDFVRREPVSQPPPVLESVETQPLSQVLVLCRRAMRLADVAR